MILVTGGTGLIGSRLLLQLCQRHERVRAIFRSESSITKTQRIFDLYGRSEKFNSIEWVRADITDVPALDAAFDGITKVYHAAALVSFDPDDEDQLRKINIEGTANVVNCALAHGVSRLCHVSSTSAIGDLKPGEHFLNEDSEWNPERPHTDYGISKHGAEMEIWRGWQEGLSVVIINPGIVIGPGFWTTGSGTLFKMIYSGMKFFTRGSTGFVDVMDVVNLMEKLLNSDTDGERFVAISENLTYEEVFGLTAKALHVKSPGIYARPWMTSIAWRMDWLLGKLGKNRLISREDAYSLHNTDQISNEKIKKAFNFEFRNVRQSIAETAQVFLKDHSTRGASAS